MSEPQEPSRVRAEAVVDLGAIRHNVTTLRARVGTAQLMTVVKADAYGHGILQVAGAARQAGADWIGAAVLEEALALRAAKRHRADLLLADHSGRTARGGHCRSASTCPRPRPGRSPRSPHGVDDRPARVHLKIDTGMSRGGAVPEDWPAAGPRGARRGEVRPDRDHRDLVAPGQLRRAEEPGERGTGGDLRERGRGGERARRRPRTTAPGELRRHARPARDPLRPGPARHRDVRAVAVRARVALGRARVAARDDVAGPARDGETRPGRRPASRTG